MLPHDSVMWIVHNGFIDTEKHFQPIDQLKAAADRLGVEAKVVTNNSIESWIDGRIRIYDLPEKVLFWDKDIRLARMLESAGAKVFNPSAAIEAVDDKSLTAILLSEAGVPMPETVIAPVPSGFSGYGDAGFIDRAAAMLGEPFVLKECHGSYGRQVHLFDAEEAKAYVSKIGNRPFLMQRYVSESEGRDVRIHVVDGEVVASMERAAPQGDFRSNVTNGGSMSAYEPSADECDIAIRATEALGLCFAGVDILRGADGPLVCEVNSNAHMRNILNCTGVDVAEHIIRMIRDA